MNNSSSQPLARTGAQDFLATVWPRSLTTESESQHRKKLAIRGGQLALVAMVLAAVAGTIAIDFRRLAGWQLAGLIAAGLAYLGWSLYGMRGAVRLTLWEDGPAPTPLRPRATFGSALPYFAIQLALAALVNYLGGATQEISAAWLVLLPPVAHSVILLPRLGIGLVSVLSMAIFVGNILWWYGWQVALSASLQFSFAVLFTLVFTLLAVSSERARSEVQRLAGQLGEANRQLRAYAVQAEELAATRERNRLAREIHDTLGHYLTVVNVQIEAARAVRDRDPARARDALDKAQALTQEGLQEIRRSVAALRASPLDNKPLTEALREVVAESRTTGLAAELQVLGEARALSPPTELTLYRAGQEGLTNVRKHARAARAQLVLDFRTPAQVRLRIQDNGMGAANDAHPTGGFGLLGLRERAQLLGGNVRVQTAPGTGFTLEVEVPG